MAERQSHGPAEEFVRDAVAVLQEPHQGVAFESGVRGARERRDRHAHERLGCGLLRGGRCGWALGRSILASAARCALDSPRDLVELEAETAREDVHVPATHRGVLDVGNDRRRGAERPCPAFHSAEIETDEALIDHELEHRDLGLHEGAHRRIPALQAQIARVQSFRGDRDEALGTQAARLRERAHGGLLPRGVRIEREHHLGSGVVADDATEDPHVIGAERRAARGHGRRHAREMAGHHVRVALHDHHPPRIAAGDVPLGEVQAVEHLGLAV